MLKLYSSSRYEGVLGGASPFIYKLEAWLRLANLPYETVIKTPVTLMDSAPRGTVPYVELDGEIVGDSHHIIDRLKAQHNDPLDDARLTSAQHAQGHLIQALFEYEMYYILAHDRWVSGDYKTYGQFFFADVSEEDRDAVIEDFHKFIEQKCIEWKVGRFELEIIHDMFRKNLEVLADSFGEGPWLFGENPTTYDAGLFGQLASVVHFPITNPCVLISREHPSLVQYCDMARDAFLARDALRTMADA